MEKFFGADKCRLQEQIHLQTETIIELEHRIQVLESKLRSPQLLEARRVVMERELDEVKQMLINSKKSLTDYQLGLQTRRKPVALVACLVFGCFLLYSIYVLMFGP